MALSVLQICALGALVPPQRPTIAVAAPRPVIAPLAPPPTAPPPAASAAPPVQNSATEDWREFRARLANRVAEEDAPSTPTAGGGGGGATGASGDGAWWVHELAVPERGCVLLAQPHALFPEQPLMHRAAVLVLEHDDVNGTVGLLLERDSARRIGDLLKRRDDRRLRPFADEPLRIGGDVLTGERVRLLTRRCDVPGRAQVVDGLYECSVGAASRLVAIGAAKPEEFELYAAVCQWSPRQLADELAAAIWLPVAASEAALRGRPGAPRRPHALYFELTEGAGGEYARQARLARTAEEVTVWLADRTGDALDAWQRLARRGGGEAEGRVVTPEEVAMEVHGALHTLDNVTDVSQSLDSLAEQVSYIWFTKELDALSLSEAPPKDPSALLAARRRKPPRAPKGADLFGLGGGVAGGAPTLRVAAPDDVSYSKQNALLAINLLLFDAAGFSAAPEGAKQSSRAYDYVSLPTVVRRGHGGAALLTLCTLYSALARRVGLSLQIVRLTDQKEGPRFLLRLPGTQDQREMYVDVAAEGRLRSTHDLTAFLPTELAKAPSRELKRYVAPLSADELGLELLIEMEGACAATGATAEAAFWRVQQEVLHAQQEEARREREKGDEE